jgi:hypothetical protein
MHDVLALKVKKVTTTILRLGVLECEGDAKDYKL